MNGYLYLWGHVAHEIGKKRYKDTQGVMGVQYHFKIKLSCVNKKSLDSIEGFF